MALHYRDSLALACCQNPTYFCTAHAPVAIFSQGSNDLARQWFVLIFHGRAGIPGPQKPIQNQSLRGETMTRRIVTGALVGALAVAFSSGAAAQANPQNSAYVLMRRLRRIAMSGGNGIRRETLLAYRLLDARPGHHRVRSGSGTEAATAAARCRLPAAAAAPPPPPPPPPPAGAEDHLASKALFDFDKAVPKPEGMAAIDTEIIAELRDVTKLELVLVTGHTDRIGSQAYKPEAVRSVVPIRVRTNLLVSKRRAQRDKIETLGMGKTQPVPGVVCTMTQMKALIACLAPNRRVDVGSRGRDHRK